MSAWFSQIESVAYKWIQSDCSMNPTSRQYSHLAMESRTDIKNECLPISKT